MLDFVFVAVAVAVSVVCGFSLGFYFCSAKLQNEDIDYNVTIIKEDIVSLNIRFQHLEDMLRNSVEDKSL